MEKIITYEPKKQYEIVLINGSKKITFIKKGSVVRQFIATHRGHYDKIQVTEIAIEQKPIEKKDTETKKEKKEETSQPAIIDNTLKN